MRGAGAALYPPRGTRRSGRGGLLSLTPLRAPGNQTLRQRGRLSLKPSARLDLSHPRPPFLRGPPGPPRGTPTRPLGEPGHPTLKPGSLTRPNRALRRTVPLVTPGEIYHWSPLIDLGFGRPSAPAPGTPRGRTEAARVGLLLGRQKLGSRDDFQWIAASELLCHAQNPDPESGRLRVI